MFMSELTELHVVLKWKQPVQANLCGQQTAAALPPAEVIIITRG